MCTHAALILRGRLCQSAAVAGTRERRRHSSTTGGDAYNKFMRNEGLSFLHKDVPTSTAKDIDLALTALGPIMVSWDGGLHVSLVVAVLGLDLYHHDPAVGPNQRMPVNRFNIYRTGRGAFKGGMLVRDPQLNQWARYQKELVLASDGVTKKDGWPTGWWRVRDGSTWYYYLGNDSIAMSSKTAPSSPGPRPSHTTPAGGFSLIRVRSRSLGGRPPALRSRAWKRSGTRRASASG